MRLRLWLSCLLLLAGCASVDEPPRPDEPSFKPGDYGGNSLPDKEDLFSLQISPDGQRVALMRARTPGSLTDPRDQLWITDRDGSNARLIAVNVRSADWAPDGKRLAVTVAYGIAFYVHTIDLETKAVKQWTGEAGTFFDKAVVSNPRWFRDGERLLVTVTLQAFEQRFKRGVYTIHTGTGEITGPHVELMDGTGLGFNDRFVGGQKYGKTPGPLDGNVAVYGLETGTLHWITRVRSDSTHFTVGGGFVSPVADAVLYGIHLQNAYQLFVAKTDGTGARQLTTLGGTNPLWTYDGSAFTFVRDVYRGPGAHNVPFLYSMATGSEAPLWPALPDSVPAFPPLSTQATARSFASEP